MQANKALYVIVAVVLAIVGGMAWYLFAPKSGSESIEQRDVLDISINDLTPEEIRAMGIQGDTPQDTLRTLVATSKSNERKFTQALGENEKLRRENERLNRKEVDIDYHINEAVRNETRPLIDEINELKRQLVEAATRADSVEIPNEGESVKSKGMGLTGEKFPVGGASSFDGGEQGGMRWVLPSDQIGLDANGKPVAEGIKPSTFGFPTQIKSAEPTSTKQGLPFMSETDEVKDSGGRSSNTKNADTPFFTLPENSTLLGSVAMTALIGRVPVGNNITDPYPFKVVIGRENLIANGFELPDVEGAIVSGTATGDWTLSCVRGAVTSFTFVFSDGRIVTSAQNSGNRDGKIGWLSDEFGIPCVRGERKTNAAAYLGTNFLLAGASAAAQGFAQAQTTTVVDGSSVVGAVTGDQGKFILGQALGSGLKETAEWFRQRYGEMFDAVYVPPGHSVAIHLDKEVVIDYSKVGRKVKYHTLHTSPALD